MSVSYCEIDAMDELKYFIYASLFLRMKTL